MKYQEKELKKQKEVEIIPYFFLFFTNLPYERQRITFRDAHQKPLTSCGPLHDVRPKRDDHFWWSFSHGNHACSRDGDCGVEMFSSLLYIYLFVMIPTIWGAKVLISFELRKKYQKFSATFCVFY